MYYKFQQQKKEGSKVLEKYKKNHGNITISERVSMRIKKELNSGFFLSPLFTEDGSFITEKLTNEKEVENIGTDALEKAITLERHLYGFLNSLFFPGHQVLSCSADTLRSVERKEDLKRVNAPSVVTEKEDVIQLEYRFYVILACLSPVNPGALNGGIKLPLYFDLCKTFEALYNVGKKQGYKDLSDFVAELQQEVLIESTKRAISSFDATTSLISDFFYLISR